MFRHRKANKQGAGKIPPFLQVSWGDCGMTVFQGSEERADPPFLSAFDDRKIYKPDKVTKYVGHIDFRDLFFYYFLCEVMIKYMDGEHSVKT